MSGIEEKGKSIEADASWEEEKMGHQHSAAEAAETEHSRTLWQALKAEPKAVMWSVAVSTAIIMEGYDIVLVTSLFAQNSFSRDYGSYSEGGGWQVAAKWQSALGIAPIIGAIVGAFLNGWLTVKFGFRKVLLVSLLAMTLFIFLIFFAVNLTMILVGLILCGISWGVFATVGPAYAAKVCSLKLRGHLTVYVNLCWALGQLISAGVLRGFANNSTQWAYRIPFGLQWAWPIPLFAVLWFCPESPWWLVRRGRRSDALRCIGRLASKGSSTSQEATLSLIEHTVMIEEEDRMEQSAGSFVDCFKGVDLRRTEIACMAFAAQIWCGTPLGGTPAYFFVQAGLSSDNAFTFSTMGLGIAAIGTIISWGLLSRFGRRTLYIWGLSALSVCLLVVGILSAADPSSASSYAQAGIIIAWMAIYYMTVGPICYAIISEIGSVRLRNQTVCLSRMAYYSCAKLPAHDLFVLY
ncbi:sugar transporter [Hortaea werneckii]|nr:sugar transporter [Hortaea werneckii]